METSPKNINEKKSVDAWDALYNRRAVRDYLPKQVHPDLIHILLDAAIQAPTALHEEARAFAVIQNKERLNRLSVNSKEAFQNGKTIDKSLQEQHVLDVVKQKDFNVFYNASTLIVIYSTFEGPFVNADCWLAAENFMLAAYAKGLGTCPIGLALLALNSPEWKEELNIPADAMAIAPIIVGWPAVKPLPTDRNQPTVFSWK